MMNILKKIIFTIILYCHAVQAFVGFGPGKIGYNNAIPKEFWTIKQLANGKFIVVGDYGSNNTSGSVIVRFTQNGLLDTTFAQPNGFINDDFDNAADDKFLDVIETADHRLLVAGETGVDALIVKYLQHGGRDTDFWDNGQISFNFPLNGVDKFWQIHEFADNKIIVCGSTSETIGQAILVKSAFDGFADNGFGTNGVASFAHAVTFRGMLVLESGKIVVTGYERKNNLNHAVIAQFAADGQLDTDFGTGGFTNFFLNQTAESNALRKTQEGKYIIVGSYGGNAGMGFVARFTSQGELDTSFGTSSGFTALAQAYLFWDCVIDQQQRIVAVGRTTSNNTAVGIVARFLSNGQLDTTFATHGYVLFNQVVVLRGIILTADQKIVVCGDGKDNKGHVISLLSDGTLDNAFTWNVRTYQNVQKSLGNTIGLLSGR